MMGHYPTSLELGSWKVLLFTKCVLFANILMFLSTSLSSHVTVTGLKFLLAMIKQFLLDVCWGDLDYQINDT